MRIALTFLLLALTQPFYAQSGMSTSTHVVQDNPALTSMYTTDQKAREGDHIDWGQLAKDDEQRRKDLRQMLAAGQVETGTDYYHAALIFQHGQNPDDYLLAHVLSMDAVAMGSKEAKWLSAATFDRYLLSSWQPQVFGTQFHGGYGFGQMTRDKINSTIVTDPMRSATCVTASAQQERMLDSVNHGGKFESTQGKDERCK